MQSAHLTSPSPAEEGSQAAIVGTSGQGDEAIETRQDRRPQQIRPTFSHSYCWINSTRKMLAIPPQKNRKEVAEPTGTT
jgi:hypothetical protein